jgi:hypothetical protein
VAPGCYRRRRRRRSRPVVAQEGRGDVAQQPRGLGRNRSEHLFQRRAARRELGHTSQGGLLVGQLLDFRARLAVG